MDEHSDADAAAKSENDAVDEASEESFPASDAPSFWAGPDVDPRHRPARGSTTSTEEPDDVASEASPPQR